MKVFFFMLIVVFICVVLIGLVLIFLFFVKLNFLRILFGFMVQFSMFGILLRVVEIEVISKLEVMLVCIKGIKNIYFIFDNGLGSIIIELDKYVDIDVVCFEVFIIIWQIWLQFFDGVSYFYIRMKCLDENVFCFFMLFIFNVFFIFILIQ